MNELRASSPPTAEPMSRKATTSSATGSTPTGARTTRDLQAVKKKYDPDGLFFVHNGVGSEDWSPDGFTRISS